MAYGDHLYVYCRGYSHHGIETEGGLVIHFDSDAWRKLAGRALKKLLPKIREVTLDQFALGREIHTRHYDAADPPETAVARARGRLGEYVYHVVENNCEHFAIWCKTGRHQSTQVESFRQAIKPLGRTLATSAVMMRHARFLPPPLRPWAYGTIFAVTAGRFATRYLQFRWDNIRRGES